MNASNRPPTRAAALILRVLSLWLAGLVFAAGAAEAAGPQQLLDSGQAAFQKGAFGQAAADWEQALDGFRKAGLPREESLAAVQLANALQSLGQQRRAVQILEEALARAAKNPDPSSLNLVKSRLGAALVMTQEPDRAGTLLREALDAAKSDPASPLAGAILNDLGNLLSSQQKYAESLAAHEESAARARRSGDGLLAAQALCNAASVALRSGDRAKAAELNGQAVTETGRLGASHAKAAVLLTAGQNDRQIRQGDSPESHRLTLRAHQSLQQALELGQSLEDPGVVTYALGYLSQLYEEDRQPEAALSLSRRAAFAAQQARQPEALYRWEWQTARLLRSQGSVPESIAAYRNAVQTLQGIRQDLSLGYGNTQARLSFRETQGPLFFELADLLLQSAGGAKDPAREQALLAEARDTVEQLKTVELESYFCDDCADAQRGRQRAVESVDAHTAVLYLIPLPTRTEILVGLTSGLRRFTVDVGSGALTAEVTLFRHNLETRTSHEYLDQARQIYDWMIRPVRPLLQEQGIHTLVLVPDGAMRTIPFSTLHDGKRFLIEDLAVAVVPGLSLVEPRPIDRRGARLLLSGLSLPVQGFAPLNHVAGELRSIQPSYPGETLLDQGFTSGRLNQRLTEDQFSIVHIASHGKFDRDVRNTFVLTYDSKLTLNDLEAAIRPSQYRGRPVDLLVLSACQTAAGDDRAALGLAGVAIKAGARSALATLWFVNDQSTSVLVTELYRQFRESPSLSKAQALQAAQIAMLHDRRFRHPCYWSPYLLIGNWL